MILHRGERNDAKSEPREGMGRARPVEPEEPGIVVARYPEWDRAAGIERPDWTTVREIEPALGPVYRLEEALARDPGLAARIDRLVRAARVGRITRLKRQPDGLDLDLDAAIDAAKALRTGEIPDERIHLRKIMRFRDLAAIVLIDISESTRDLVPPRARACWTSRNTRSQRWPARWARWETCSRSGPSPPSDARMFASPGSRTSPKASTTRPWRASLG